jgi:hypothetical protein
MANESFFSAGSGDEIHVKGVEISDDESFESLDMEEAAQPDSRNSSPEPKIATKTKNSRKIQYATNPLSAKFDVKKFTQTEKFSEETTQMQERVRLKVQKKLKKMERNKRMNKNLLQKSDLSYKKLTDKGIFSSHEAMKRDFAKFKVKIDSKLSRIQKEKLRDHIREFKQTPFSFRKDGRERVVRYCERMNMELLNLDSFD